jgi:hypothetical protein
VFERVVACFAGVRENGVLHRGCALSGGVFSSVGGVFCGRRASGYLKCGYDGVASFVESAIEIAVMTA